MINVSTLADRHDISAKRLAKIAKKKDKETIEAITHKRTNELGLLHGIPISIKDHINEKGKLNTCGCTSWADNYAREDALLIKYLK